MRTIFIVFAILILLIIAAVIYKFSTKKNGSTMLFSLQNFSNKTATITINKHTFTLLVANTAKEKEIGLSEKNSLPEDTGMLFPFDHPDYYPFWMKHMKFPIDMLFIRDNHLVTIFENVKNPSFPTDQLQIFKPFEPADKVLEVNAGISKKYNIKKSNEVKIDL